VPGCNPIPRPSQNDIAGSISGNGTSHRTCDNMVISRTGRNGWFIINPILQAQDGRHTFLKGLICSRQPRYQRISWQIWQHRKGHIASASWMDETHLKEVGATVKGSEAFLCLSIETSSLSPRSRNSLATRWLLKKDQPVPRQRQ